MAILNQIKRIVCSHYIHENVNKRFSLQMLGPSTRRKEGKKQREDGKRKGSDPVTYDKGENKKKESHPVIVKKKSKTRKHTKKPQKRILVEDRSNEAM